VFCVVASAGTTSTGAVDPLDAIADVASAHHVWMHVDGAYGFPYKLVPGWAPLFAGIARADSVCWDPHKQFGVPIPNSLLFAKNKTDFERVVVHSAYFNRAEGHPNPGLKSAPSTRPLSALALVTSMLHQGLRGVIERLEAPLVAMSGLAERLARDNDIELAHPPDLGVLCFRFLRAGLAQRDLDVMHRRLFETVQREGVRSIAMTELDGKTMFRLVAISPAVTIDALVETVEALRALARRA
jgi:L-2,4-diaminobutyrate decarboxylase